MAIKFNSGTPDYARLTSGLPAGTAQPFSVSLWYMSETTEADWSIVMGGSPFYWAFTGPASTGNSCYFEPSGSSYARPAEPAVGTWMHLAFATSGGNTSNNCAYYQDGTKGNSGSSFQIDWTGFAWADISFGVEAIYGDKHNGRLAAVKMWTAQLSESELDAESAQYLPVRTSNLYAFWPFTSSLTADLSGNGHTLTTSGSPSLASGPSIPWGGLAMRRSLGPLGTRVGARQVLGG